MLVSFDVVSLFSRVPLDETTELISDIFPPDITTLFRHCIKTTYFQWDGDYYEQTDGVAMGNPLSPVISNFLMEKFEKQAIE